MMKKKIVFLLACFSPFFLNGQEFDNLTKDITAEMSNCEIIATKSHKLLAELGLSDIEKSRKILSNWEMECGRLEPVLRIRLLLDLYEEKPVDYIFANNDWTQGFKAYEWKMDLKWQGRIGSYENNKGYYGYVPLNSDFDEMTNTLAKLILKKDSLDNLSELVALYYNNQFESYEKLIDKSENPIRTSLNQLNRSNYKENMKYRFFVQPQIGIASYFGNISSKTNYSGYLGLKFGIKFEKWRLNADAKLHLHQANDSISILVNNDYESFKTRFVMQGGGEISRQVWESKSEKFELIANLGAAGIQMNTYTKEYNSNTNEEEDVYLNGFQIFTGLMANFEMKNYRRLGVQVNYNYLQYMESRHLNEKLNGHGANLSLVYNF